MLEGKFDVGFDAGPLPASDFLCEKESFFLGLITLHMIIMNIESFLLIVFQGDLQALVVLLPHAVLGGDGVDGLPPPVLLVAGEGCIQVRLFLSFLSEIEVPISFGLLVVPVLIIFEFVEPMGFLQRIVVLAED